MRPWERVIIATLGIGALYAMWRFPVHGAGIVVLTVCVLWLGRSVYRNKLARNPLGGERDFSMTPVMTTVLIAAGLFFAAILWTMLLTYAVRYKYLPDTWLSVSIVLLPALILIAAGAVFFMKAIFRFQIGGKR